jgi:hypothetical protein
MTLKPINPCDLVSNYIGCFIPYSSPKVEFSSTIYIYLAENSKFFNSKINYLVCTMPYLTLHFNKF